MKWTCFGKWLSYIDICFLLLGCQQLEEYGWESEGLGILHVETRSVADEGISYPMNLYAFSKDGECAASQTVDDDEEEIRLGLSPGTYRIVAVAGYSDNYALSSVACWDDTIKMLDGVAPDKPLMMGMADVEVDSETEGKLEIALSYSVASIDVELANIPSEAKEVVVTFSSFYSSLNLKGEYMGSDYSLKMVCALDTANRWTAESRYVFPGKGDETALSIALKMEDDTKTTYGYVWKDTPKANQAYHLKGDYSGSLILNGTFTITGWNQAEDVEFEFGAEVQPDEKNDQDVDLSGLPQVGSFWNGTLIVDVGEADDSGVEVLLMSLDEWTLDASQVDELISEYNVNGIAEWRLPIYEEVRLLKARYSGDNRKTLNQRISEYDKELVGLDGEARYLCLKSDAFYSFAFVDGTKITSIGEMKYRVRLVKSYWIER